MSDDKTIPELMSITGALRLSAEGTLLHDGTPFTHPGVTEYFFRALRYVPELNRYVIQVAQRAVPVEIEDTAYVVRSLDVENARLFLNDGTTEEANLSTIAIRDDNVFYLRAKDGQELARLSRAAMQQLLPYIEETNNGFSLVVHSRSYPIPPIDR